MRLRITVPVEWPDAEHIEIGLTQEQCVEIVRRAGRMPVYTPTRRPDGSKSSALFGYAELPAAPTSPTHQQLLAVFEAAKRITSEHGPFCGYSGGGPCDCGHPELHAALRAAGVDGGCSDNCPGCPECHDTTGDPMFDTSVAGDRR